MATLHSTACAAGDLGGRSVTTTALALESDRGDMGPVDLDFASALLGLSLDAILANALPPARSKALLGQLIDEVRVVSGQDVSVTYRVPPEVRMPDGMVVRTSQYANQPAGVLSRVFGLDSSQPELDPSAHGQGLPCEKAGVITA
jgi:hypothetical protein